MSKQYDVVWICLLYQQLLCIIVRLVLKYCSGTLVCILLHLLVCIQYAYTYMHTSQQLVYYAYMHNMDTLSYYSVGTSTPSNQYERSISILASKYAYQSSTYSQSSTLLVILLYLLQLECAYSLVIGVSYAYILYHTTVCIQYYLLLKLVSLGLHTIFLFEVISCALLGCAFMTPIPHLSRHRRSPDRKKSRTRSRTLASKQFSNLKQAQRIASLSNPYLSHVCHNQ